MRFTPARAANAAPERTRPRCDHRADPGGTLVLTGITRWDSSSGRATAAIAPASSGSDFPVPRRAGTWALTLGASMTRYPPCDGASEQGCVTSGAIDDPEGSEVATRAPGCPGDHARSARMGVGERLGVQMPAVGGEHSVTLGAGVGVHADNERVGMCGSCHGGRGFLPHERADASGRCAAGVSPGEGHSEASVMRHGPKGPGSLLIKPSRWAGQAPATIPKTGQFGSKAHERAEGAVSDLRYFVEGLGQCFRGRHTLVRRATSRLVKLPRCEHPQPVGRLGAAMLRVDEGRCVPTFPDVGAGHPCR
jgi:hypothetical protein